MCGTVKGEIFIKAVILAGGQGSRLRPLTCDLPKPMVTLFSRPVLEYIIDLLALCGVNEAYLTLGYMPQAVLSHFADSEYNGVRLNFCRENTPLGTAGAVRNACGDGCREDIIVISGDAVCNFKLKDAVEFHNSSKADVTIVTTNVDDPREYGLIHSDENGRVAEFIEKPPWERATCSTANTGIYIINGECLKLIPENSFFDFANDLFPLMMKKGMTVCSYNAEGYWCDIGNTKAYLECHRNMLDLALKQDFLPQVKSGVFSKGEIPAGDFKIIPPVWFGDDVSVAHGCVIGPYACIDNGCVIENGCKISKSVILKNSRIEALSSVYGSLVCDSVHIKDNACVYENSVIGRGCIIGSGATVGKDVNIWPEKRVFSGANVTQNVKYSDVRKELFENGRLCRDFFEPTAQNCARLGSAVGSSVYCKKTGVACAPSERAKALKQSFSSGAVLSGAHIWDFGECFKARLNFYTDFCSLDVGIYIDSNADIYICGKQGMPLHRCVQRDIEQRFSNGDFKECGSENCRAVSDMCGMGMMYNREVLRQCGETLDGISVNVSCENESVKEMAQECIVRLGGVAGGGVTFVIDPFGEKMSVVGNSSGKVGYDRLFALCAVDEMRKGNDVALPYDAPYAVDLLAQKYAAKTVRYFNCPIDDSDKYAREIGAAQRWSRDALFMSMKILLMMKQYGTDFDELINQIPDFYVTRKTLRGNILPSHIADYFGAVGQKVSIMPQGVTLGNGNRKVKVVPLSSGLGVEVMAEASQMEIANELCSQAENSLLQGVKRFPLLDNKGYK